MIFGFQNAPKIRGETFQIPYTFLDSNFERIFFVLASENQGKIEQSVHFYRKRNFCENHCFPEGNHYFSGSEPRKIDQNWMLKRDEK